MDPPEKPGTGSRTTPHSRALNTALNGGALEMDGTLSGSVLGKPNSTEAARKKAESKKNALGPQPGPQMQFLTTKADIAVFGGSAGSGKTFALLMEATRHVAVPNFTAVIFRREYPDITNPGGLWDESYRIFPLKGGRPRQTDLVWKFPKGSKIKFAHMQREEDRFSWRGAQVAMLGFDQLETFSYDQFSYMLSRNRSTCGVRPYIRATCNPDPDHFLRDMLRWWIDDESGYPIKERGGIVRWFVMRGRDMEWGSSREELVDRFGPTTRPKSFTFIPATVYDNKKLLEADPDYLANLEALLPVERARLLEGNWNIRETAGEFFHRSWITNGGGILEFAPKLKRVIRYWDRAATAMKNGQPVKGASATAGAKMGETMNGSWVILDMETFQKGPIDVDQEILDIGLQDGATVEVILEQDPAQAGKKEAMELARTLGRHGLSVSLNPVREDKGLRFKPFARQCKAGNVAAVRGPYLESLFRALENFDGSSRKSDEADAISGGFLMLGGGLLRAGTW